MQKISFILNIYNQSQYLERVISALKEVGGHFRKEYIVTDQGSTDNSLALVKSLTKDLPNTTIISNKHIDSRYHIHQNGMSIASGDYIKFLDGQTILAPDSAEHLIGIMKQNNQKIAFGKSEGYGLKPSPKRKNSSEDKITSTSPLLDLLKNKTILRINSPRSIVSRDLFQEIDIDEVHYEAEDLTFFLKCASKSDFVFSPKLVCYNLDQDSKKIDCKLDTLDARKLLLAAKNLIEFNPTYASNNSNELYKLICTVISKKANQQYKTKIYYLIKSFLNTNKTLEDLKRLVLGSIEKNI
ncbi:MAG: glycosyltransferase family 2 protein [Rickettsiaceae bacterium]|nr:glycosyltransferase family 2 protein [Rickettsiaceae bacterium]